MQQLEKVAHDIKALNIQGATNIAIAGVTSVSEYLNRLPTGTSNEQFFKELTKAIGIIFDTRPTEPGMQNGLKKLHYDLDLKADESSDELKALAMNSSQEYVKLLKETKQQIIEYGAELIQDGYTVMTHCHSSLSSGTIIQAFKQGKDIKAISTETRPRFQGRKTAIELASAGVPTTQVVDSAMRWIMRRENVDLIIIGMDAITSLGTVINKIGSRLLALAAKESDIPLFISGSLLKFDSHTLFGNRTAIEQRDIDEITKDWEAKPANLRVLNPAFESISRDYIDGLISEKGIFAPELVHKVVADTYPFMLKY